MNPSIKRLAPCLLLALAPLAGCATVTPPPPMMALEGASQGPIHGTSVTVLGVASAGIFVDGALAGGARVDHRFSRELSVGAEGLVGSRVESPRTEQYVPQTLYVGRAHTQYNPGGSEHVALTLGAGGGAANNALAYVTVDTGVRLSHRYFDGVFEPYVGGSIAVGLPVSTPAAATRDNGNDFRYLTTVYLGLDTGFVVHATERLDLALDFLLVGGYSASNNALMGSPSVGLRYTFGGEPVRR